MTAPVNWRNDAACRDIDPELFFPVSTTGPALNQILDAKRLCRTCPVRISYLAWALDHRAGQYRDRPAPVRPGDCSRRAGRTRR